MYVRDLGCGRDQERIQRRIATYGSSRSHSNFYEANGTQLAIILADTMHFLLVSLSIPVEPTAACRPSRVKIKPINFVNDPENKE
jgi:hypothetical protein